MFDIRKMTTNASFGAIGKLVNIELVNNWGIKENPLVVMSVLMKLWKTPKYLAKTRRSSQATILKRVYILEINTQDLTTTKENFWKKGSEMKELTLAISAQRSK